MGQQVKDLLTYELHMVLVTAVYSTQAARLLQYECPYRGHREARVLEEWTDPVQLPPADFVGLVALGDLEVKAHEARRNARVGSSGPAPTAPRGTRKA